MSDLHTRRVRTLLNLVSYLKNNPGVKLSKLAKLFGMDEQEMETTLLSEVIVCGIPPYSPSDYITVFIDEGRDGKRVTLHQHEQFKRPLKLTTVEALALKTAIQAYTRAKPDEYRAIADTLLDKIAEAMSGQKDLLDEQSFVVSRQSHQLKDILSDLDEAIADCLVIEIEYFSAEHGALAKRKVHPYTLFEEGSRFYLRAYCEARSAQRTFRADRIRSVEFTEESFTPPKIKRARALPGWDGTAPKGELVVRFEPFVAEEIEQEWAPRKSKMNYEKDGSLVLRLPLYSEAWALGWVLSFGQYAELLEPDYLREDLIERVHSMLAATGRS